MSDSAVKNAVGKDGDGDGDVKDLGKRDSNEQVCILTYLVTVFDTFVRMEGSYYLYRARDGMSIEKKYRRRARRRRLPDQLRRRTVYGALCSVGQGSGQP